MKVKIGDTVYDSEDEPIMLILSEEDKHNISGMSEDGPGNYCGYPDEGWTEEEIIEFMKIDEE